MYLISNIITGIAALLIYCICRVIKNKLLRRIAAFFLLLIAWLPAHLLWEKLAYNSIIEQWNVIVNTPLVSRYESYHDFVSEKNIKYGATNLVNLFGCYISIAITCLLYNKGRKNRQAKIIQTKSTTTNENICKNERADWFYSINRQKYGPFSEEQIFNKVNTRELRKDTLVWIDGMNDWKRLDETRLSSYLKSEPPPLPTKHHATDESPRTSLFIKARWHEMTNDEKLFYGIAFGCLLFFIFIVVSVIRMGR